MSLLTQSYLRAKAAQDSPYITESYVRSFSAEKLAINAKEAKASDSFDIFLSHSFEDAIIIKALRDELVSHGYKVYVDWIEDPQLDRTHVTKANAAGLKLRMTQSRSLLFATSAASKKSIWMPWELGYMDSLRSSRVGIAPIVADNDANKEFKGQEYLGLYPYLDKTGTSLYIHESAGKWVTFKDWLSGKNP